MHDPLTVAFEVRRPWPTSSVLSSASDRAVRWRMRLHHDCGTWCADDPPHKEGAFPWWKPSSYSAFWRLGGRNYYWPALIVVWHREPGGRDGLTGCSKRVQRRDGSWSRTRGWRWHVHHWKIQVPPLQQLRRYLFTRCTWCGGKDRKGDRVNVSHQWGRSRGRWWQGEKGLFHHDCSSIASAHSTCVCEVPVLQFRDHGRCAVCGHDRSYGTSPERLARVRELAAIPQGERTSS